MFYAWRLWGIDWSQDVFGFWDLRNQQCYALCTWIFLRGLSPYAAQESLCF
jgi:hypothetical protein